MTKEAKSRSRRKTAVHANGSSPIKRGRRSRVEVQTIRDAICYLLAGENPMTCRQVFYRLVSLGKIDKTEAEYKSTVVRLLGTMRREGDIPFDWIADNTRWMRKPRSYDSMHEMLKLTQETYRRALWNDQHAYVEVWLEKDALAGVVFEVTSRWDVPLMVTRGYPSLSFLYTAAESIAWENKPTYLYYFGDHDPSGVDIPKKTFATLRDLAPDAEIDFKVVAVTPDQIEDLDLPTRPTKKTDTRSKTFCGDSVEVDAIPPHKLRELVADCITQHIDTDVLQRTRQVEAAEKRTLGMVANEYSDEFDEE